MNDLVSGVCLALHYLVFLRRKRLARQLCLIWSVYTTLCTHTLVIIHLYFSRQRSNVHIDHLAKNVHIVAESLARHIYGLSSLEDTSIFRDSLVRFWVFLVQIPLPIFCFFSLQVVSKNHLASWIDLLSKTPRSQQLFTPKHPLLTSFLQSLDYWTNEARLVTVTTDKKSVHFWMLWMYLFMQR